MLWLTTKEGGGVLVGWYYIMFQVSPLSPLDLHLCISRSRKLVLCAFVLLSFEQHFDTKYILPFAYSKWCQPNLPFWDTQRLPKHMPHSFSQSFSLVSQVRRPKSRRQTSPPRRRRRRIRRKRRSRYRDVLNFLNLKASQSLHPMQISHPENFNTISIKVKSRQPSCTHTCTPTPSKQLLPCRWTSESGRDHEGRRQQWIGCWWWF